MKIGVLLSGCGLYDGTDPVEATLTLLALDRSGVQAVRLAHRGVYQLALEVAGRLVSRNERNGWYGRPRLFTNQDWTNL